MSNDEWRLNDEARMTKRACQTVRHSVIRHSSFVLVLTAFSQGSLCQIRGDCYTSSPWTPRITERRVSRLPAASPFPLAPNLMLHATQRHPKYRHHRPRRPRQDDAGRRPVATKRPVPRIAIVGRLHPRFQRPRARAGDHHPRQEHRPRLQGGEGQHHRHARATPISAARSSACSRWPTGP